MFSKFWQVLKFTANGYIEDNCLSRGAAIAYYTVFSLAPVLIIVIAIAGFVFGAEAARGALLDEISSLMGRQGGEAIQTMIASASQQNRSGWAGAVGLITLVVTASGVFSELQVTAGAIATAVLFNIGKFLIGLYLGSSSVASSFGAAGAFALLLLWIYYSSQIFLIGAEFTRAWADIVHERGPDTASAEDTTKPIETSPARSPNKKLQALKSDLTKNIKHSR
jgi:uncharacterized BrkB/YihY/UPF0761 family membrane protein